MDRNKQLCLVSSPSTSNGSPFIKVVNNGHQPTLSMNNQQIYRASQHSISAMGINNVRYPVVYQPRALQQQGVQAVFYPKFEMNFTPIQDTRQVVPQHIGTLSTAYPGNSGVYDTLEARQCIVEQSKAKFEGIFNDWVFQNLEKSCDCQIHKQNNLMNYQAKKHLVFNRAQIRKYSRISEHTFVLPGIYLELLHKKPNKDTLKIIAKTFYGEFTYRGESFKIGEAIRYKVKKKIKYGIMTALWSPNESSGQERGFQFASINLFKTFNQIFRRKELHKINNKELFIKKKIVEVPLHEIVSKIVILPPKKYTKLIKLRVQKGNPVRNYSQDMNYLDIIPESLQNLVDNKVEAFHCSNITEESEILLMKQRLQNRVNK